MAEQTDLKNIIKVSAKDGAAVAMVIKGHLKSEVNMINKINMGKVFAKVIGQVSPIELYTKERQKSRPLMVNRQNAD